MTWKATARAASTEPQVVLRVDVDQPGKTIQAITFDFKEEDADGTNQTWTIRVKSEDGTHFHGAATCPSCDRCTLRAVLFRKPKRKSYILFCETSEDPDWGTLYVHISAPVGPPDAARRSARPGRLRR